MTNDTPLQNRAFLFHTLREMIGSDECEKLYLCVDVRQGKTEVIIEKTIKERFPIQDLAKAVDLYERLTCGSGRKLWRLEELAHPYNPN